MVKAKVGGIMLGGFAAYMLLSKGIGAVERGVRNICVAHEWKNYYKYGKAGNMVPPGYSMRTNTGEASASKSVSGDKITEAIVKAVSDAFGLTKREKGASEGQETASEKDICPEDCKSCTIEECQYANLKYEGEITEWEDHKPVAGRYPWNDGRELEWHAYKKAVAEEDDLKKDSDDKDDNDDDDDNILALDFSKNPDGEFIEVKKGTVKDETDSD